MAINYGDKIPDGSDLTTIIPYLQLLNNKVKELKTKLDTILQNENVDTSKTARLEGLINLVESEFNNINNEIAINRDKLYNLMLEGGYKVTSSMTIDDLMRLLEISDINLNEVKQIACGSNHTVILKNEGSVWVCGDYSLGQLGLGDDTSNNTIFTKVTTNINNDVKQIACGNYHTFILKNDGSVWACGYNNKGQLGLNVNANRIAFTQVTTNINNDIKQICCGGSHTFMLKYDGSIWACGLNEDGQLGLGNTTNRSTLFKLQRGF